MTKSKETELPATNDNKDKDQDAKSEDSHDHDEAYDPNKIPPDFEMAIIHGDVCRVFKDEAIDHEDDEGHEDCPCCGLASGERLPLNCNIESIYHLGSGYALYFTFLKLSIALLGVLFLVSGVFNLYTNATQRDCFVETKEEFCPPDRVMMLSIANKRDNEPLLMWQVFLNCGATIAIMFFFHYIRYRLRKVAVDADDKTITPSDYTIKVDGLPLDATDQEIKTWIESFSSDDQNVRVRKITRAYNMRWYVEHQAQRDKLLKSFKRQKDKSKRKAIEQEINKLDEQINARVNSKDHDHTPTAYVSLTHAQMVQHMADKFKKKKHIWHLIKKVSAPPENLEFRGNTIKIKRAPEPSDIIWANLSFPKKEKMKDRYITVGVTFFLIVVSFSFILSIFYWQRYMKKHGASGGNIKLLSIGASLLICLINTLISMTIKKLSEFEKFTTKTGFSTAVARKQAIAQVINTAFTSLMAEIVLAGGIGSIEEIIQGIEQVNIYGRGGLIGNMFFVFVTSALYSPILGFIDPAYLIKKFKRSRALKQGENAMMTQSEANLLFEDPQPNLPNKYAGLIKSMALVAFYAPAMPIAIIFTIIALVINYWLDKYLLLRRQAKPPAINTELSNAMVEYLELMVFTFAIGNVMFLFTLVDISGAKAYNDGHTTLVWLTIFISLFQIIFPMEEVNKFLFKIDDEATETLSFDQARSGFSSDYDMENPITRTRALHEFMDSIRYHTSIKKGPKAGKGKEKQVSKEVAEAIKNAKKNLSPEELARVKKIQ